MKRIRVLLVDDHVVVRKGLVHVLNNHSDIDIVGEAESGEEALHLVRKFRPELVIMDIKMDGLGGIRATELLVEFDQNMRVIGLSAFADQETVDAMIDAGASGFLQKDISAVELVDAIRKVYEGEILAYPTFGAKSEQLPRDTGTPSVKETIKLGNQQQMVLALLTKGFTNPEIAQKLGISTPTARYHVSAILRKLDVSNRAEAVALAVGNNLVLKDDFQ